MATFQLGPNTLAVPMALHAENRARLVARLRADPATPADAVVFLKVCGVE